MNSGRANASASCWGSMPSERQLGYAGRHVEVEDRPAPGQGDHAPCGGRGSPPPDGPPPTAAACRRRCRSRTSSRPRSTPWSRGPLPDRGQLARPTRRTARRGSRRRCRRADAVPGGHHVVEAEGVGQRLHHVVGRGGGQHQRAGRRRGARRTGPAANGWIMPTRTVGAASAAAACTAACDRPRASVAAWRARAIPGSVSPTVLKSRRPAAPRAGPGRPARPGAWRRPGPGRWPRPAGCGRGRRRRPRRPSEARPSRAR